MGDELRYRKCNLCLQYVDMENLTDHLYAHNVVLGVSEVYDTEKYVSCNKCSKFMSVREITTHLRTEHPLRKDVNVVLSTVVSKRPRIVYNLSPFLCGCGG